MAMKILAALCLGFIWLMPVAPSTASAAEPTPPAPSIILSVPDRPSSDAALVGFALQYAAISVVGGALGYALLDTMVGSSAAAISGAIAGTLVGSLGYLFSHVSVYHQQSNYR